MVSRRGGLMVRASLRGEPLDGVLADAKGAGDAGRAVAHHVQAAQPQPGPAELRWWTVVAPRDISVHVSA